MEIIIIVAMAANRVIGIDNKIPWHIPEELQHFKKITMGYSVIMGRKTHQSIGFPLPGRKNIILSKDSKTVFRGCSTETSIEKALELCKGEEKVFILGGESIFSQTMNLASTIFLTVLDREVVGDTYFPKISADDFRETKRKKYSASEDYTVITYERI